MGNILILIFYSTWLRLSDERNVSKPTIITDNMTFKLGQASSFNV